MTNLGMLEVEHAPSDKSASTSQVDDPPRSPRVDLPPIDYKSIKLNLVKHLCEPPNILCSNLSKNALRLLHSGEMSDMEFEVISNPHLTQFTRNAFHLMKVHIFRAHRAIVCSRCEYFRRALLSGMKEDINRKIIVQDTSPVIFRRFLLYLYGAPIDRTVPADQICELMLLGDRYSLDELKDICEQVLKAQIDEESVIFLLSIADRFNACTLKSNCLSFISNRVHLINMDIFVELSPLLQDEVHELIQWRSRTPQPWHSGGGAGGTTGGGTGGMNKRVLFNGLSEDSLRSSTPTTLPPLNRSVNVAATVGGQGASSTAAGGGGAATSTATASSPFV